LPFAPFLRPESYRKGQKRAIFVNTQNPRLVLYEVVRWAALCQKSVRAVVNALSGVSTQAEPD